MANYLYVEQIKDINSENKNLMSALAIISEFWDVCCCVTIKDGTPIGVALAPTIFEAKLKALDCNPIEALNQTIAFSDFIDEQTAKILSKMNFNTIILPKLNENYKKYFEKVDTKIIELGFDLKEYKTHKEETQELTPKTFKVATKLKPTQEQVEDMVFAWKILKTLPKDGIVIAKDFKTSVITFGTDAKVIETAMDEACDGSKEAVIAISKNIDDMEKLHPLIQGRITGLIEPKSQGNKDLKILKSAEKYGITVVVTGHNSDEDE